MNLDLATIVKRERPNIRRKTIVLAPIETMASQERALAGIYLDVVKAWRAAAIAILDVYTAALPVSDLVHDDAPQIDQTINERAEYILRVILGLNRELRSWVRDVEVWHRRRTDAGVRAAVDLQLGMFMGPADVQAAMDASIARNMELIRNVSEDARGKIAQRVWAGFSARTPRREMAKEISEATDMVRDRALRIASDQTVKLGADMDRARQEALGLARFKWRSSHKVHYRVYHQARDGKIYPWEGNDLNGDLPGHAPFCGCKAQAVLDLD